MVRDSIDECFRVLRINDQDQINFKKAAIDGLEYHQTYHRDLLDIPKSDVQTYAEDFFLDGSNLSQWWPSWTGDQRRVWLSGDRLEVEQALTTLFDHWADDRRNDRREYEVVERVPLKTKATKSRTSQKKSPANRQRVAANRRSISDTSEGGNVVTDVTIESSSDVRQPRSATVQAGDMPMTPDQPGPDLRNVVVDEEGDSQGSEELQSLPTLQELFANASSSKRRRYSNTVEPQSPQSVNKGKQPDRDPDSSYVVSQVSTIGQPPISPPPTRHANKRKQIYQVDGHESDDEPVVSPVPKRNRARRNMQSIEKSVPNSPRAGDNDDQDAELSQILMQMSCTLQDTVMEEGNDAPNSDVATEGLTDQDMRPDFTNAYDPFIDLADTLHQYLRKCKTNNVRRANDAKISKVDAEKLHIRAGILEHLHCDLLSRIKAIHAKRQGHDKSDVITSHTLYA